MDTNPMQTSLQPFIKLVQGNMELLANFSGSPQAAADATANLRTLVQQSQDAAAKMMQSQALMQLAQGMMKNYTEFLAELGQNSMSAFTQAQSSFVRQAQETTAAATQQAASLRR